MTSHTLPTTAPPRTHNLRDPAYLAFALLRTAFTVAPIVFGLDKFFNLLTDWQGYLAPLVHRLVPGTGHQVMLLIGVVELAAGVLVAVRPQLGGYVVAAWLAGIIMNLLLIPGFYDVALRDFGLLLAALALAQLARAFRPGAMGAAKASAS
jgi:hypothetical protein